jgi:hypothetical protein
LIRYLLLGVWAIMVAMASVYAGVVWSQRDARVTAENTPMIGFDYVKTQPLSVPIIKEGRITGYVVLELVYTVDAKVKSKLPVPLDVFLLDEAFRSVYTSKDIDFDNLKNHNIDLMTSSIRARVNNRFGTTLVHEVLVEQFNFVTLDMVRNKLARTN